MLVTLVFLCILFVFGYMNTVLFRRVTNYANSFLLLWCGSAALSALGFYGFYVPPLEAYGYIFLTLAVFEAATLFSFQIRSANRKKFGILPPQPSVVKYKINSCGLAVLSLMCTLALFPSVLVGIRQVIARGFYYLRLDSFSNRLYPTPVKLILINVIQPCILATITIGFHQFVHNKRLHAYLFVALINAVLYILVFANRWILMEIIFIVMIILLERYSMNIKKMILQNFRLVLISCILLTIIVIITMSRQISGSRGFFYNVYSYFVGNIHLFGVAVNDPQTLNLGSDNYLYGACLLSAPISLLEYICSIFGIDSSIQSGIGVINEVTQTFYMVSSTTKMNNNFTMIYSFLRDGGIVGIIVNTSILAAFMHHSYECRNRNLMRKFMYVFSYTILLFTTFEWFFGRLFVMMTLIAIMLMSRLFVRPVRPISTKSC